MRFSSPPVSEASASASGVNAYAASAHPRQGYVHSPAPPGVGGYQDVGFDGWGGMNDATAQMGVQFGKSAVAAGQEYVEKNVSV